MMTTKPLLYNKVKKKDKEGYENRQKMGRVQMT